MKLLRDIKKVSSAMLAMSLIAISCSRDRLLYPTENTLYLKVVDTSGSDITTNGEVEVADLYVFNANGIFENKITLTKEQIIRKEPICFKTNGKSTIVVWGNLNNRQVVEENKQIDLSSIRLLTTNGFAEAPDDLFFGITEISKTNAVSEISISRKVARMNITVKGLPKGKTADDYGFKITQKYNGYTFKGIPIQNKSEMKQKGFFTAGNDFVSSFPFNLLHTIEGANDDITVALTQADDEELAVATKDENNKRITPKAGETVNVLIDLSDTNLKIRLEVTDWNELIQWTEW